MAADHDTLIARLTGRQRLVWDALVAEPGLAFAELCAASGLEDVSEQLRALNRRGLVGSFTGEGGPFLYPTCAPDAPWPRPPMRAPVPPSERAGFRRQVRDGLTLVVPTGAKQTWRPEERPWRSLAIDPQRRVVSSGFPKFFTAGEDGRTDAALKRALGRGEPLTVTEKLDGSLVIRSVVQGQVMLRTRGTLEPDTALAGAAMDHCAEHHPQLLDPGVSADCSLLLEFCSPEHRIVLGYERPALTLVGAIDHGWPPRLADDAALGRIAAGLRLPLVATHDDLPRTLRSLREEVGAWQDREGVVVRLEGGQTLVKLKSEDYRRRHMLRFTEDPQALVGLVADRGLASADDLVAHLLAEGVPAALAEAARPHWAAAGARA